MTKGNLYYYFQNKEEILFACHDYSLDELMKIENEQTPPFEVRVSPKGKGWEQVAAA